MYLQLSGQVVVVLLESWGNFKQITDCSFGRIFFYLHLAPNKPEMLRYCVIKARPNSATVERSFHRGFISLISPATSDV